MAWGLTRPAILDFGSGIGNSATAFRAEFPDGAAQADVSAASPEAARALHGGTEVQHLIESGRVPVPDASFDIVFAACVFHHIPEAEHGATLRELRRITRPGGRLAIFEHNPLNPLTRHAVRTCPFDENAVLIGAHEMARRAGSAGWRDARVDYHLFVPGPLRALRPVEALLRWCPAGAQYACTAVAP